MDVPDENEDLEALRGVKRCLSSDNLHKDIVPPQKNGNSYFANRGVLVLLKFWRFSSELTKTWEFRCHRM